LKGILKKRQIVPTTNQNQQQPNVNQNKIYQTCHQGSQSQISRSSQLSQSSSKLSQFPGKMSDHSDSSAQMSRQKAQLSQIPGQMYDYSAQMFQQESQSQYQMSHSQFQMSQQKAQMSQYPTQMPQPKGHISQYPTYQQKAHLSQYPTQIVQQSAQMSHHNCPSQTSKCYECHKQKYFSFCYQCAQNQTTNHPTSNDNLKSSQHLQNEHQRQRQEYQQHEHQRQEYQHQHQQQQHHLPHQQQQDRQFERLHHGFTNFPKNADSSSSEDSKPWRSDVIRLANKSSREKSDSIIRRPVEIRSSSQTRINSRSPMKNQAELNSIRKQVNLNILIYLPKKEIMKIYK
jgi:hypothetical protein